MNPKPTPAVAMQSTASPPIARRAFLWTAAVAALGALVGEWWGRSQPPGRCDGTRALIPGAVDLSPGTALAFSLPDATTAGFLVRLSDKTYAAFDRRCPHLGCPVLWSADRARFECPCHKAAFDGHTGEVLQGPPDRGLKRLAVEMHGSELWITSTARHERRGQS